MDNNNNIWTSINCQNLGSVATTITAQYFPEVGYGARASDARSGIVPNAPAVILQHMTGSRWVGSALVTSSPATDLVCVVNQVCIPTGEGSSYEGFNPNVATSKFAAPLIVSQDSGAWGSINIQNLGPGDTNVSVDLIPAAGYTDPPNPAAKPATEGGSAVFLFPDVYGNGNKFVGAAIVTSDSGASLLGIINKITPAAGGENQFTYNAFPMTP